MSPVHTLKQATTNTSPTNAVPHGPNAEAVRFVSTVAPLSFAGSIVAKAPDTMPT